MEKETHTGPGKSHREGITLLELMRMFPNEEAATNWFESIVWNGDRHCPHCGSTETSEVPNSKPMPYWCPSCRKYFSVRTGTAIARSNVSLQKWAFAIYLCLTSLKSVSSMKLHRDIGVSQPTAWFMLHRIREAWKYEGNNNFTGPVEVDETFMGGKDRNKHNHKRSHVQGPSGKTVVMGMKDRNSNKVVAKRVSNRDKQTVHGFIREAVSLETKVYTDDHKSYKGLPNHESVNHSVGEFVREQAHTNGIESFWAMLKRAHKGTFHKISPKHLDRYIQEFAGKHNMRDSGTFFQMRSTVAGLVGRNLLYRDLVADNGLSSLAR